MEACLEAPPSRGLARPPIDAARWVRIGLIATIGVGVVWRVVRYLGGFPIWGDEAMLLLNILDRDYAGLTQHLRFAQVAPLFFLWLEKTAILAFGTSEWSVHLFPFLAGLASLAIFYRAAHVLSGPATPLTSCPARLQDERAAHVVSGPATPLTSCAAPLLAVAILAISYYPMRHSAEVKPYAFDLLCSITFAWLTLEHLRDSASSRWLVALSIFAPVAVFTSYPSVFVGGAVSLVLLPRMREATWTRRGIYVAFNVLLCGAFLAHYAWVGQKTLNAAEAEAARAYLRFYWRDAFPPENATHWPLWLVKVFTGNILAYPMGGNRGASTGTFLLVLLGSFTLWRQQQRSLLALCWLPFALNLLAAILEKYPFGDSARITLHLAPFICILMAHGIVQAFEWIRPPTWRTRCELGLCAALFTFGVVGIARDIVKPYKTEHDRDVRFLAHDIAARVAPDETVYLCHQREEELIAEFLWYLRTEIPGVDWLKAPPLGTHSCWLIRSGNEEPSEESMRAYLGRGWRVTRNDARMVVPENSKTPPMFCRWTRMATP